MRRRQTIYPLLLLLLVTVAIPAPAQQAAAPAPAQGGVKAEPGGDKTSIQPTDYRIGPEDILQISVWKNEALSRTVPVRPDGKVSLPLLNDLQAAGHTPMELRDLLIEKLQEYIPSPEVSVIVVETRSFKVSVIGEVLTPGRYDLRSRTTVLDILAMAGGFNNFASRARIFVLRPGGNSMTRIPFNYNKAVAAGGEQENFYLLPGDIVVVP